MHRFGIVPDQGLGLRGGNTGVMQHYVGYKVAMIAFLGVAHIHARDFVNLLLARPKPIVKWVWDHQAVRRQKIAELLHCSETGSLTEVLSDPEVSAVRICSKTNRHSTLVRAARTAGKDIFIEKPLALSSTEAFELASLI